MLLCVQIAQKGRATDRTGGIIHTYDVLQIKAPRRIHHYLTVINWLYARHGIPCIKRNDKIVRYDPDLPQT